MANKQTNLLMHRAQPRDVPLQISSHLQKLIFKNPNLFIKNIKKVNKMRTCIGKRKFDQVQEVTQHATLYSCSSFEG